MNQARSAFVWFDLTRFLAASAVVLEHARDMVWIPAAQAGHASLFIRLVYFLTGFGHEAVMAFFVLSGFWISKTVDRRLSGDDFWAGYLIDRIARLSIVLLPALVVGGLLDFVGLHLVEGPLYSGSSGAATMTSNVAESLTIGAFLGNAVFLQTLVVPTFGSNGPLWSLANEFWYYLWYPALLSLVVRRRPSIFLLTLGIAVLWPKLVPGFVVWLLGSALYRLDRHQVGRRLPALVRYACLFAGLVAVAASATLSRLALLPDMISELSVGLSFFLLLWSILIAEPRIPSLFEPLAHYGADRSFSLYVSHFPLVALVASILLYGNRLAPTLGGLAVLASVIALAWAYGWLFASMTEKRTATVRDYLHKRLLQPPIAAQGEARG